VAGELIQLLAHSAADQEVTATYEELVGRTGSLTSLAKGGELGGPGQAADPHVLAEEIADDYALGPRADERVLGT